MSQERPKTSYERVVGQASDAKKEKILKEKAERFDDQIFEELKGKEREKTPDELQIISLANEATNELRRKYGLDNFDIPSDNIHIIKEEEWAVKKSGAFYRPAMQGVAFRETSSKMEFMAKTVHEMIHFKSYNALQLTKEKNETYQKLRDYRVGLMAYSRDGKESYFTNLNEAMVEEITKRIAKKLFKLPIFKEEVEITKKTINEYPSAIKGDGNGNPLFNKDTYHAETVQRQDGLGDKVKSVRGVSMALIRGNSFTYKPERKMLHTLIDKLFEKNNDTFEDREEVFELFAKGLMTGNILPMGRLIEETLGTGTFRKIAELDSDVVTQEKYIASL